MFYKALGLNLEKDNVISFVGGGGKSTGMNVLAQEFKNLDKKVLITTTTMIFYPEHKDNDKFILGLLPKEYEPKEGTITLFGKTMVNEKIKGPNPMELEEIYNRDIFDIILIEADGAKRKPITAPASHEPLVPDFTRVTIGVIGLDSVGQSLDEDKTHRPEILRKIFNVELPHIIGKDDIIKLIRDENGLFKDSKGKRIVFLNKADNEELRIIGDGICQSLLNEGIRNIFITQMTEKTIYNVNL